MQTDILIIGQGLAGSLLAWELIGRGCRVVVVDSGEDNASMVAAGIINPITGMRFVKTPDVETLLPVALKLYAQLSAFFGQAFYLEKPLFRLFKDQDELNHCKNRLKQADYATYLSELTLPNQQLAAFSTPFGYIGQQQTGHLLTLPLLGKLKQFFIEQGAYKTATLDYNAIQFIDSGIHYQDITANRLVFCEGHHARTNPWFSWLPFQLAKGELLTLAHHLELPDAIVNYGNWLLPLASGLVRIGATFDREHLNSLPSLEGKQSLLWTLKTVSPTLAQSIIVAHQAGIRPCTADKYPFIGKHSQNNRIAIFNGFGAKGSLQIPWYSQRCADQLLHNMPLPASCDIQRYHNSHFLG
jgi:glycine/D-amino acid oxidase-like deaminating enzyme